MNTLKKILVGVDYKQVIGGSAISINNLQFDSRKVQSKDLFVAVKGTQVDGHDFIDAVTELGVSAIVCETLPFNTNKDITYVEVENAALALGQMSANYYGNPSKNIKLIGITGTNGKTTTATLLYQLFLSLGYHVGLLSTIRNNIGIHEIKATHTTPDSIQLNALLAQMVDEGCEYCFMEVSSHAAHQGRIAGLHFAGGVFTNITQDHLDYHNTFAEYIKAKKIFFDSLPKEAFALVNSDDKNGRVMLQNTKASKQFYALHSMADFKGKIIEAHIDGMLVSFNGTEIWTQFIGNFNAYNLLSVYAVASLLNQNTQEVLQAMSQLKAVDGRFEYIKLNNGVIVIVDYAHTPDALKNVLETMQEIRQDDAQIITVVGAGGNRDKSKRPLMGEIAAKMSNRLILTSDNPRNENPEDIIEDIKQGIFPPYNKTLLSIENREEAIKTACAIAQPGDMVLVAGKGHENYQEIQGVKHHFDDKEVIANISKTI